jgi:protein transport protein SEC31
MVKLREIPKTAAFAWSSGSGAPYVVTGTRAGAVDADFSDETKLELWDLGLDDRQQGVELQPIASLITDSRCRCMHMILKYGCLLSLVQIS